MAHAVGTSSISSLRGAYFLANDKILDFAIAFLNSFRTLNPAIPLCLVPFDDHIEQLLRQRERYGFLVWEDRAALERCDEISTLFHGHVVGHYRKLAMWEGPFEEFVYIDADTVVLEDVAFVFQLLDEYAFITSHSNLSGIRKWVWKESIFDTGELNEQQIAFAANTGFIVSRRGCLSFDSTASRLPHALTLRPHMELLCAEQPLLNYLIVTSGLPYTSLLTLRRKGLYLDFPLERWAGGPIARAERGRIIEPRRARTLLVHWAGQWEPATMPQKELWEYYRNLDSAAAGDCMPAAAVTSPTASERCGQNDSREARMGHVALTSVVTASVLAEFQLLKRTFEMFHGEEHQWYIRCDRVSQEALSAFPNVRCTPFCEEAPELIATEFPHFRGIVSERMNAMEDAWATGGCDAVALLDADLLVTAPFLQVALQLGGDLVLTPYYYPTEAELLGPTRGYFNTGFVLSRSRNFHVRWRELFEHQPWKHTAQACLNDLTREFDVRTMSESANIGFWRSANAWSYVHAPIPRDCMFLHVHLFQPLRTRRGWVDKTFGLHCLSFLLHSRQPEHRLALEEVLARDDSNWYAASLALSASDGAKPTVPLASRAGRGRDTL